MRISSDFMIRYKPHETHKKQERCSKRVLKVTRCVNSEINSIP